MTTERIGKETGTRGEPLFGVRLVERSAAPAEIVYDLLADLRSHAEWGGRRQRSKRFRLTSVEAAYWTNVGTKEHLRWVMPHPEDALLDALARLHAAGQDSVAEGSRFVGMFRAHGLLAPVWDLPVGTGAEVLEEPAARFAADLEEALEGGELSTAERSARAGLANRQVTIR